VLKDDLTPYLNNATGLFSPFGGKFQPTFTRRFVATGTISDSVLVGIKDSSVIVFSSRDQDNNGLADIRSIINVGNIISSSLFTPENNGGAFLQNAYVGDVAGNVVSIMQTDDSTFALQKKNYGNSPVTAFGVNYFSYYFAIVGNKVVSNNNEWSFDSKVLSLGSWLESSSDQNIEGFYAVILTLDNSISILSFKTGAIRTFKSNEKLTGSYGIADIDGDGNVDILVGTDNGLYAYSRIGVLLEHFPMSTDDGAAISGSPTVLKQDFPTRRTVLFSSSNGQIYAYQYPTKLLKGFPIQTGGSVSAPFFYHTNQTQENKSSRIVASSTDTSISIFEFSSEYNSALPIWNGPFGNVFHTNYYSYDAIETQKSSELLPKKFAYNWPNPVYSGSTNIRYFLGKSGTVKIKIVNLAGELVEELNGTSYAGMDNEVQWNITNIQSGIYFAQITASGSGEEQSQIVKIAVVK